MWFILVAQLSLPNLVVTPGVTTNLTKDQICNTQWGHDRRFVTEKMKQQIADLYFIKRDTIVAYLKGPCCEFDHLISRELGGADDIKNIWPQPWSDAKKKDTLENWLHTQVCKGNVSLLDAQTSIKTNWVDAYTKMGKR